tara:strand:- start:327 stop:701 length:375 start_codon:yes stop_codon:yes gene_type:complete
MNYYLGLTIIGLLTGLITGVIGAGPEVLIVPLLAIFGLLDNTKKRIGTSLFMLLPPIGLFAAYKFYKKGYVDIKAALYMAFLFTVGASISAEFTVNIDKDILRKIFAIFTICLGIYYLFTKNLK